MNGKPERNDPVETWLAAKVKLAELVGLRQEEFHCRKLLIEYREKAERGDDLA